jgi:hypothetical protein
MHSRDIVAHTHTFHAYSYFVYIVCFSMCSFLVLRSLIAYFIDCILYVICHAMIRFRMHCNWRGDVHPPYRRLTYSAFQAVWVNLLLTAVHPPYVQRVNSGATGRFNFHLFVALHLPYVQRVNSGATGRFLTREQPLPGRLVFALRRAVMKNIVLHFPGEPLYTRPTYSGWTAVKANFVSLIKTHHFAFETLYICLYDFRSH